MTEDEAKTKWCPMVRLVVIQGGLSNVSTNPGNRFKHKGKPSDDEGLKCIGSACMMWSPYSPYYRHVQDHTRLISEADYIKADAETQIAYEPADGGDCGLKPTDAFTCEYPA